MDMADKRFSSKSISLLDRQYRANLINSVTGFKSLCLIATISPNGISNVTPFSQVFHLGADPPLIGLVSRPLDVVRHTLENILATRHFTLNHVHETFLEKAHQAAAKWEISEFTACGLTEEFTSHPAPYVKESFIKMGLKFRERIDIPLNRTVLIVGEIVELILPKKIIGKDGYADIEKAGTLTVSGLDCYHKTDKIVRYSHPSTNEKPSAV
jgi:flavin reductase (DIM6/NTAB) family NADH-FMN oxidoreductase RutF